MGETVVLWIQVCHAVVSLARVVPQLLLKLSAESHETRVSCRTKIARERGMCRWHWSAMLGLVDRAGLLIVAERGRTGCDGRITGRKRTIYDQQMLNE